jgi:hypothetical protein
VQLRVCVQVRVRVCVKVRGAGVCAGVKVRERAERGGHLENIGSVWPGSGPFLSTDLP